MLKKNCEFHLVALFQHSKKLITWFSEGRCTSSIGTQSSWIPGINQIGLYKLISLHFGTTIESRLWKLVKHNLNSFYFSTFLSTLWVCEDYSANNILFLCFAE